MKHLSIVLVLILLFIGTQAIQETQVHYSTHYTLEHALSIDPTTFSTPECAEEIEFDSTVQVLTDWIDLLNNPFQIQFDRDLLKEVRALIVKAKTDIETVESEFEKQVSETQFVQTKTQEQVLAQLNEQTHPVYQDEMVAIFNQMELLMGEDGNDSELVDLAQGIIDAIDKLDQELISLQEDSTNFSEYSSQLTNIVKNLRVQKNNCYGTIDTKPVSYVNDRKVSSATLDDFEVIVIEDQYQYSAVPQSTVNSAEPESNNNSASPSILLNKTQKTQEQKQEVQQKTEFLRKNGHKKHQNQKLKHARK